MIKPLPTAAEFSNEFRRCCREYSSLEMYIAWAGDPSNSIHYESVERLKKVTCVVGVAFCQTHPMAIKKLQQICNILRVAKDAVLFHPKVYLFNTGKRWAIFIGSSNFTYHGFGLNTEVNLLWESDLDATIGQFVGRIRKFKSDGDSFIPSKSWLANYERRYERRRQKIRKAGIDEEPYLEDSATAPLNSILSASWQKYVGRVRKGLKSYELGSAASLRNKLKLLNDCAVELPLPWQKGYFKDLRKRKLIAGIDPKNLDAEINAWLGHVGASGRFRQLLASGTDREHRIIVTSINAIAKMDSPLNWQTLHTQLDQLVALGPSMKVWGRVLAIVRPDLYCTISASKVRAEIQRALGSTANSVDSVDGYINLIRRIHLSPWFLSGTPKNNEDAEIWQRRVAFLDVIFYKIDPQP